MKFGISVILPVYNEGEQIKDIFDSVLNFSAKNPYYHFIFVDDGSKDGTKEILKENLNKSKSKKIVFLSYPKNKGKGYAIKKGVEYADKDFIYFTDGDLAYSLEHLKSAQEKLLNSDMVIGCRGLSKDSKNTKLIRKISGKIFNFCSRLILDLKFTDMQAGFKGFKKNIAKELFDKQKINQWAFDTEIIYIAKKQECSILEVPVKVSKEHTSKPSNIHLIRDSIKMFFSLLKIRLNDFYGKY